MRKSEIKTAEERQRRCGGRERRAEQRRREKVRSHAVGMLGGGDCWRDCPIFHSHNQSQLSVRGPIRLRGRAERGGKEWEYFGFWKKLEGERGAGGRWGG